MSPPKMGEGERGPWGVRGVGSGRQLGQVRPLERSHWGPHAWESHVAPMRAAPELLWRGSWHRQQCGQSPEQIHRSRGIAGRGWSSSVACFPPWSPLVASHRWLAARSIGASATSTSLLQPMAPTFRSREQAEAHGELRARAHGGNPERWQRDGDLEPLCGGFVWFGFSAAFLMPTTGEDWGERSSLLKAEQPQVFKSACAKSSEKLG